MLEHRKPVMTATLRVAVEETWQQTNDYLKTLPPMTDGLVVKLLKKDGPAGRAGVQQWDVILAVDGKAVRTPDELLGIVRSKKPGDKLLLKVFTPQLGISKDREVALGAI